jgi:phage terminase large subunit-like protein
MVGAGRAFVCLFSAANGVGKTALGANIVANLAYGQQNDWFNHPLFKKFPFPSRRGRIVSNTKTIETTIGGLTRNECELEKWLPVGRYKRRKGGRNFWAFWETDTGFTFDLMTYEQDPEEFESATLGWAWFDEPPTHAIFKATVARMRRGGIIFITETPLDNAAWMYDHIVSRQSYGQREYMEAEIEDNCIEHGVRGILQHRHIQQMVAEYEGDEAEIQARIKGKFMHLVGRVFKKFETKIHVVEPFEINEKDYAIYMAYDYHAQLPDALMWLAVDRHNQWFIVDEMFKKGTDEDIARWIHEKEDGRYRVVSRVMDQLAFQPNKLEKHGRSYAEVMSFDHGYGFDPASKQRATGIRLIENAIDYKQKDGRILKFPKLYVFASCLHTRKNFENITWQKRKGKTADDKDPVQKTIDKDDHFVPENLYRLLIQNPTFLEMEDDEAEKDVHITELDQGY